MENSPLGWHFDLFNFGTFSFLKHHICPFRQVFIQQLLVGVCFLLT